MDSIKFFLPHKKRCEGQDLLPEIDDAEVDPSFRNNYQSLLQSQVDFLYISKKKTVGWDYK